MTDLVAFLRACYDEDERVVSTGRRHNDHGAYAKDNYGCLLVDPARVLADIESKRRIVDAWEKADREVGPYPGGEVDYMMGLWQAVEILAQPYADRPGFEPAWEV